MKNTSTAPMSYIYDGRACLGFVLSRGRAGFEAFDREQRSRGDECGVRCCRERKGCGMNDFCDTKNAPHEAGQI